MSVDLKERARKLKQDIPILFLVLKDAKTPLLAKVLAGLTVAYALSPVDLVPDFIPVLGYLDDVILLPAMIAWCLKLVPEEVWEENRKLYAQKQAENPKKQWYYALPIIIIWLMLIWFIYQSFFKN